MNVKKIIPMSRPLDVPRGTYVTRAEIRIVAMLISFAGFIGAVCWPVGSHLEASIKSIIVFQQFALLMLMLMSWRNRE